MVNILLFDSGNPFDNKAPERLDERENTTDGTGHGLADVFESMAKSNASFVIEKLDKKADIQRWFRLLLTEKMK